MVTDSDKELAQAVVLRLGRQGAALARTTRRLELERAAIRASCLQAVKMGIPVSEVARLSGVTRKSIHEWLRT